MENKIGKIYNIEFWRIILTTAIIFHHFYHQITNTWNADWVAVEFFFVISGFVFAINLNTQKTILNFAISKLIRFVPLILVSATIIAICTKFDIQSLFADIFLLPLTGLYNDFGFNAPAWFVAVLFWISLFYFTLLKNIHHKYSKLIIGIITFYALAISNPPSTPKALCLFRGLAPFGVGYFVGDFCKGFQREDKNKKSILITLLETTFVLYFCWLSFSFYEVTNTTAMIFQMAIILCLFYLNKGYISSILEAKFLTVLSKFSLATFLTHAILYVPILKHFVKHYSYVTIQIPSVKFLKKKLIDKTIIKEG